MRPKKTKIFRPKKPKKMTGPQVHISEIGNEILECPDCGKAVVIGLTTAGTIQIFRADVRVGWNYWEQVNHNPECRRRAPL